MLDKKVGIIASIPTEIEQFRKIIHGNKWDDNLVRLDVGGVGKCNAALRTQKMISEFKPDLLFYTGYGGALSPGISKGDIGVVSGVIDAEMDARAFDYSLSLGEYPFTRERVFMTDKFMFNIAMDSPLNIRTFDAFVATSSVFFDSRIKEEFNTTTRPLLKSEISEELREPNVIVMESFGFIKAAYEAKIPCLILRYISNTLTGDAAKDYDTGLGVEDLNYLFLVAYVIQQFK